MSAEKYNLFLIGDRIRQARIDKGYNQNDLIEELKNKGHGISRNTLSDLENGNFKDVKFSVLVDICNICDCDFSYLLCENECKTRDIQSISDYTGLHPETITFMHKILNDTICNDENRKAIAADLLQIYSSLILHPGFQNAISIIQLLSLNQDDIKREYYKFLANKSIQEALTDIEKSNEIDNKSSKRQKGGNKNGNNK